MSCALSIEEKWEQGNKTELITTEAIPGKAVFSLIYLFSMLNKEILGSSQFQRVRRGRGLMGGGGELMGEAWVWAKVKKE